MRSMNVCLKCDGDHVLLSGKAGRTAAAGQINKPSPVHSSLSNTKQPGMQQAAVKVGRKAAAGTAIVSSQAKHMVLLLGPACMMSSNTYSLLLGTTGPGFWQELHLLGLCERP